MNQSVATRFTVLGVLCFAAILPIPASAQFCGCFGPVPTLSEQLADAEAVVLVKWIAGTPSTEDDQGSTELEIVEVMRQPASALKDVVLDEVSLEPVSLLRKGDRLRLPLHRAGSVGDLFLLAGSCNEDIIDWNQPEKMTPAAVRYVKKLPKPEQPVEIRLAFFAGNLSSADEVIVNDSLLEIDRAAPADIARMAKELPRDQVRAWLGASVNSRCQGWYAFMLGVCGTEDDAKPLERIIREKPMGEEDFRPGVENVMTGYLMLMGEPGLALLDETKLIEKTERFSETYAAMQSLRFMWKHGDNRIAPERLRQSMRILLDRPELADLVIADLARMKDWSVQDRVIALYDDNTYNVPAIKRAIVRFTLSAAINSENKLTDSETGIPSHVIKAQKHLKNLEERDPKTVREARRFFAPK